MKTINLFKWIIFSIILWLYFLPYFSLWNNYDNLKIESYENLNNRKTNILNN